MTRLSSEYCLQNLFILIDNNRPNNNNDISAALTKIKRTADIMLLSAGNKMRLQASCKRDDGQCRKMQVSSIGQGSGSVVKNSAKIFATNFPQVVVI